MSAVAINGGKNVGFL